MNINRKRLRRAGGVGPEAWVGRIAVGAMVVGGAWAGWNGFKPLPEAGVVDAPSPGAVVGIAAHEPDIEARSAWLERVGSRNAFSPDGLAWSSVRIADADETPPDEPERDEARAEMDIETPAKPEATRIGDIRITSEEDLSSDVKKAREELTLRGIRSTLDGETEAMIAMNSVDNGKFARVFRAGDEFVDEKHKKHAWRVVAVDAAAKVVVLNRSGENVLLPLYDQSADARRRLIARGGASGHTQTSATIAPTLQTQSPEEIAALMRAAGFGEDEIASLLARAGSDAPITTETKTADVATPASVEPVSSSPPEGIDSIFKMMFSGGTPPMDANLPKFDEEESSADDEDPE